MNKTLRYYLEALVFCFIISLPLMLPYFKPGFFTSHDGEWTVVRLSEMYREIKDLQLPARYSGYLNFEYGYPLFNFTYPFPYYLGLVPVFLKFGFVNSIKILFLLSILLSSFFMFLFSSYLWKNRVAGAMSAVMYVYAPYRIIDLFVRGSLGEAIAFVIFPLILFFMKKIYDNPKAYISIISLGLSYSVLIMSHNVMTVLFSILVFVLTLFALFFGKFKFIISFVISLVISLCISAFFWIPAILEKNLILLSKVPIADRNMNFVNLKDLFISRWGYGVPVDENGFGYQIGLPHITVFLLVLILIVSRKNKNKELGILFMIVVALCIFLMLPVSSFVWINTPLLSEINYPWIFLGILVLVISIMIGYFTQFGRALTFTGVILATASIILFLPHAKPERYIDRGDDFYLTNQATTTSSKELMPLWVKELPEEKPKEKIETSGNVSALFHNSKKINFEINLSEEEIVRVNTIYYPGWKFNIDRKPTEVGYDNKKGLMTLNIKAGRHFVAGVFSETPVRLTGNIISLLSAFCVILFLILKLNLSRKQ